MKVIAELDTIPMRRASKASSGEKTNSGGGAAILEEECRNIQKPIGIPKRSRYAKLMVDMQVLAFQGT